MNEPVELTGLGESLVINAYRTLKLLKLSLAGDYDPLCGLSRELGFIAGNNILEELDVEFQVDFPCPNENWSNFDSLLTESTAFPKLHRVSVRIWRYEEERDNDNDYMSESLKYEMFSRLVESKALEFNFSAEISYF